MARCVGYKRDGGRCEVVVSGEQPYCYHHDPATAEKRKRVASKGGRSKPNREILEIKNHLKELTLEVLSGKVSTAPYAVANQLINTRLRAVEIERRADLDELAREVEDLKREYGRTA